MRAFTCRACRLKIDAIDQLWDAFHAAKLGGGQAIDPEAGTGRGLLVLERLQARQRPLAASKLSLVSIPCFQNGLGSHPSGVEPSGVAEQEARDGLLNPFGHHQSHHATSQHDQTDLQRHHQANALLLEHRHEM